jgi:hypothetical protein
MYRGGKEMAGETMNTTCRQCGEPGYLNPDNRCDACHEDYVDAMADDRADMHKDDLSDKCRPANRGTKGE